MKKFLQSFYGKLSLLFLFLLLILGLSQILITTKAYKAYISRVDQRLNYNLAQNMSAELHELTRQDSLDFDEIEYRIHYMMVMNPKVEIYLLDESGYILRYYTDPGKTIKTDSVDLSPIQKFLEGGEPLPILGSDPRGSGHLKPFSAAQIPLQSDGIGYLYIIIGGEQYDSAVALLRENFIFQTLLVGLLLSVAVAGIIGLILFFYLTRRIRAMSAAVAAFENGEFTSRVPVQSADEIGHLGRSFNQMADTIIANIDQLRQTDNLRRELIANVSHDLRTPLASIQGYLETILMKEKQLKPEEKSKFLNIILNDTEKLNRMVHELFDLSKFEAKQIQPKNEAFFVSELVQDVAMKFKEKADRLNITLKAPVVQGLPAVTGDIGLIERALSNLIDNALDYTPQGGLVTISLSKNSDSLTVAVQDTGVGIPEKDLAHIFDRFYRGDKKKSRNKSSTGLGLAIAQKIVELHDSALQVESREGEGSRFYFELAC
jgi:signal transduction histidine kinase